MTTILLTSLFVLVAIKKLILYGQVEYIIIVHLQGFVLIAETN